MGHRVPNHKSKCRNLHGHRYTIEVGCDDKVVDTQGASDEGMVIDFSDLKEIMMDVIDAKYDHGFVMYEKDNFKPMFEMMGYGLGTTDCQQIYEAVDKASVEITILEKEQKIIFVPFIPTAENLSKHWYELLKPVLQERGIKIKYVKVKETPTTTATYEESNLLVEPDQVNIDVEKLNEVTNG